MIHEYIYTKNSTSWWWNVFTRCESISYACENSTAIPAGIPQTHAPSLIIYLQINFHFQASSCSSITLNSLTSPYQKIQHYTITKFACAILHHVFVSWCFFLYLVTAVLLLPGQVSKYCWPSWVGFSGIGSGESTHSCSLCCQRLSCSCWSQYILASLLAAWNQILYWVKM